MELKNYAIGALTIILLVSLGFNVQPDDTHVCRSLEITKKCDRLSGTEKTCYPTPATRLGSKFCAEKWEPIMAEPEPEIITIIPEPEVEVRYITAPSSIGVGYQCSVGGCREIKNYFLNYVGG